MRVLGIIVARGGSKGIPRKNLRFVAGKTLINWGIDAGKKVGFDRFVLSTDDAEIIDHCASLDIEIPFIRPKALARDDSSVADVLHHALTSIEAENKNESFDYVVLIQPTSPLVEPSDIKKGLELATNNDADNVITVCSAGHHHPMLMYKLKKNKQVERYIKEIPKVERRQDLEPVYFRVGLFYIIRASIIRRNEFWGDKICAYEVPSDKSLCIDEPFDLEFAEFLLKRKKNEQ